MNRMTSNEALNRLENPNSSGTIYKQAAIDAIEKFSCCGYIEEDTDKLLKVINDLPPVQPEQRWIPCKLGNPKKYGCYRVTTNDGTVTFRWYTTVHGWECHSDEVIAWMPLPAPYREGDTE